MKIAAALVLALGLVFSAKAELATNQPARLKNKITCYDGKIGSANSTKSINFVADDHPGTTGSQIETTAGKESELHWTYLGQNGSKDVYSFTFTRKTKADSPQTTTDTKRVQFEGKRVVVFEDPLHAVVMEPPSAEELKAGQSTVTK
jgi:hypothetical protein